MILDEQATDVGEDLVGEEVDKVALESSMEKKGPSEVELSFVREEGRRGVEEESDLNGFWESTEGFEQVRFREHLRFVDEKENLCQFIGKNKL